MKNYNYRNWCLWQSIGTNLSVNGYQVMLWGVDEQEISDINNHENNDEHPNKKI